MTGRSTYLLERVEVGTDQNMARSKPVKDDTHLLAEVGNS
jgi:hypothetical protein